MTWHYQLTRETSPQGEVFYAIREWYVFSNGKEGWTADPIEVVGDSVEDVLTTLDRMRSDVLTHGVVDLDGRNE